MSHRQNIRPRIERDEETNERIEREMRRETEKRRERIRREQEEDRKQQKQRRSFLSHTGIIQNFRISAISKTTLDAQNVLLMAEDALTKFETSISPWKSPRQWLSADVEYTNSIIRGIASLVDSAEIEQAKFPAPLIYHHLIVYLFAHLIHCADDKSLLDDFRKTLKQWQDWDGITLLENHQAIRDRLLSLFCGLQSRCHSHTESHLLKLLALDDIGLSAHLTVMVTDGTTYKEILARRGPAAQTLLNLLQARLSFFIDSEYKSRHVKALIRLSRVSGLYPECFDLKGIEIEGDAIGGGSFADVYKGRLQGRTIALKVLRIFEQPDMDEILKEFTSEAVTWRQLSHPNVLPFYGVYYLDMNPRRICLACPWIVNGDLVSFLTDCTHADCILLSLDVAQGLEYLHSASITHGDLKGLNILVSQSQRACIADFGLATAIHSASTAMTCVSSNRKTGTLRWQAPELLPDMTTTDPSDPDLPKATKATDVYAFALVCYEMFSGQYPFHDFANDFQLLLAVQRGTRPSRPSHDLCQRRGLNDEIWHLIEACWSKEPSERPTASHVVSQLQGLPNLPTDQRPRDDFSISLPQISFDKANHAFATLTANIKFGDSDIIQA